jgi:FKBP-type peptidyl-prolyl cis-trans isomerase (trigger factor)
MTDQKSPSGDKITSVIAKEDGGNIQITFTIPFAEIKKAKEETIKEFAKDAEIPGFRRGMAPIEKVAEKISESKLVEHSLGHLLPKALAETVTENKLKIAVYPKFELISAKENEAWQIRGITCELPVVDLGDYKKAVAGAIRSSSIIVPGKDNKEGESREKKEQTVIKAVLDSVKIKIPTILIEEEADSRISNLLARLEKLGLALETYLAQIGKKAEDLKGEYATQARDAISLDLILNKIAESEGIKINEKDVETALKMSQTGVEAKKESAEEIENHKRYLESILKRRGALDFLMNLS